MAKKERASMSDRLIGGVSKGGTVLALIVLAGLFSILRPHTFPTSSNLVTVLQQASVLGMISGGLTLVLVMGDFDLSIGYVSTLTGVTVCNFLAHGMSVPLAVLLSLAIGLAAGVINGIIVAYGRLNAFIATLGTGAVLQGVIFWISGGGVAQQVPTKDSSFFDIGQSKVVGVPLPVIIAAVTMILLWFLLNKTEIGRRMDATGGNPEAARLSGIRTANYRFLGFAISGLCSGAAGIVLAAELGAGYSDAGIAFLLQAFTACFIGAVTLRDNEFHVVGTVVGVLILIVTFEGLAQLGVATYWQDIAQGGILILAVSITLVSGRLQALMSTRNTMSRSRRARSGPPPAAEPPTAAAPPSSGDPIARTSS
jgi:ribose transport system permease protein